MPPRVFITYSHDSNAHLARVLALADRLRLDGLDVRLDQYELHVPEGWLAWMHRQLEEADSVVVVCTETYRRRFEGKESAGVGLAAAWEGALTQQILYDASSKNHRFIPIIFEGDTPKQIPLVLRSATRYLLEAGYDDLYRHLTDQPKTPPPPIGTIRRMPPAPRPGLLDTVTPAPAPPSTTQASGGITVDNQDAMIQQQVTVHGAAHFGPSHFAVPTGGAPAPPTSASSSLPASPPATILLVTSNATDPAARLLLEEESRAIQEAIRRARLRDRYDLQIAPALTFDGLVHELDDRAPSILHFAGHGDRTGALLFKGSRGQSEQRVAPESLRRLFSSLRQRPSLVVFASCYSSDLAQLVGSYVGHAIGFSGVLRDDAASHFSAVLYERLAAHEPPDIPHAFALAQLAAVTAGFAEGPPRRLLVERRTWGGGRRARRALVRAPPRPPRLSGGF